jgi:hypothetical protein
MRIRGYASAASRHYHYSDARQITLVQGYRLRDGRLENRAAILIDFADEGRWSSGHTRDIALNVDRDLYKFLEQKTGLNVGYADAESDVPRIGGMR